jgi:hypothetical protein
MSRESAASGMWRFERVAHTRSAAGGGPGERSDHFDELAAISAMISASLGIAIAVVHRSTGKMRIDCALPYIEEWINRKVGFDFRVCPQRRKKVTNPSRKSSYFFYLSQLFHIRPYLTLPASVPGCRTTSNKFSNC